MSAKRKSGLPMTKPGAEYDVGYGKPPKSGQFKPGRSGNPGGRPKGAKTRRQSLGEERLNGIILDEAYRGITVRDGDRNVTVPMAQAVVRAIAVNAAKGQHRSQRLFAEIVTRVEQRNSALALELFEVTAEYKQGWERELQRRKRLGLTGLPEPLPHPDQIDIDTWTGEVSIIGPATSKEVEALERLRGRLAIFEDERDWLMSEAAKQTEEALVKLYQEDIAQQEKLITMARDHIHALETSRRPLLPQSS